MSSAIACASSNDVAMPCFGAGSPACGEHAAERAALLGQVDRLGLRADDRHAGVLERLREPERRLAAELDDDARRPVRPRARRGTTSSTSSSVSGSK